MSMKLGLFEFSHEIKKSDTEN